MAEPSCWAIRVLPIPPDPTRSVVCPYPSQPRSAHIRAGGVCSSRSGQSSGLGGKCSPLPFGFLVVASGGNSGAGPSSSNLLVWPPIRHVVVGDALYWQRVGASPTPPLLYRISVLLKQSPALLNLQIGLEVKDLVLQLTSFPDRLRVKFLIRCAP